MQYLAAEHASSGCFNGLCDFFFYRLVSTMISCLVSIIFPYRIYTLVFVAFSFISKPHKFLKSLYSNPSMYCLDIIKLKLYKLFQKSVVQF